MSGGLDSTIGVPARGTATAAVSATGAGAGQVPELRLGQAVRATVVQILPEGGVTIGLMGSQVRAVTNLQLTAGRTYDFVVTMTEPKLTLTTGKPLVVPRVGTAMAAGLLGASGIDLGRIVVALPDVAAAPATLDDGAVPERQASEGPRGLLQKLGDGRATAEDLRNLGRNLGHDQEARVLRLSGSRGRPADVVTLRQTTKALALQVLDAAAPAAADEPKVVAARSLVAGLGAIEADNAVRADQGTPQWLPLLATGGDFLRDARMFALPPDEGAGDDDAESESERARSFKIVLLLDLTRLGSVRVDVEARGDVVTATFQLSDGAALGQLLRATGELRQMLEDVGLTVGHVRMQLAPGGELPVADLVRLPSAGDPAALVDVHA